MGQTLGLAGTPAVLRTAIQVVISSVCLHSYRDVEFVTLVPEVIRKLRNVVNKCAKPAMKKFTFNHSTFCRF